MQTQEATETLAPRPRGFFAGLIHGNYFYPLSTVFFMLASFLLMPAQHVMGDKLFSTLQAAMILQGYELLLIISAAVIVRRLVSDRPEKVQSACTSCAPNTPR